VDGGAERCVTLPTPLLILIWLHSAQRPICGFRYVSRRDAIDGSAPLALEPAGAGAGATIWAGGRPIFRGCGRSGASNVAIRMLRPFETCRRWREAIRAVAQRRGKSHHEARMSKSAPGLPTVPTVIAPSRIVGTGSPFAVRKIRGATVQRKPCCGGCGSRYCCCGRPVRRASSLSVGIH